jgi:hypothetical protein
MDVAGRVMETGKLYQNCAKLQESKIVQSASLRAIKYFFFPQVPGLMSLRLHIQYQRQLVTHDQSDSL